MKKAFYLQLCQALKVHPDLCLNGTKLSTQKVCPTRARFLVKLLQPFLTTVITDVEMQNSVPHWSTCLSESKFLSYASVGSDVIRFLQTHRSLPCKFPFQNICNADNIEQVFSSSQWGSIIKRFESADYQCIAESFDKHSILSRAEIKKHLTHLAVIGGLQQMRGTPLVLHFLSEHSSPKS